MAIWMVEGLVDSMLVEVDGLHVVLVVVMVVQLVVRVVVCEVEGVTVNVFVVLGGLVMVIVVRIVLLGETDAFVGWVVDPVAVLVMVAVVVSVVLIDVEGDAVLGLLL